MIKKKRSTQNDFHSVKYRKHAIRKAIQCIISKVFSRYFTTSHYESLNQKSRSMPFIELSCLKKVMKHSTDFILVYLFHYVLCACVVSEKEKNRLLTHRLYLS